MPNLALKIKVKLLDYWLMDNYKVGSSGTLFVLLEINNNLQLVEKEVRTEWGS